MARKRYCDCGRKLLIRINGRYKVAQDDSHHLCRQCWQSERDRERLAERDSSEVERWFHKPEAVGAVPTPATS